jgi:hypothetical protein
MVLPKPGDMFGDADSPLEVAERFEGYKAALNKSAEFPLPTPGVPTMEGPVNPLMELQKSLGSEAVSKALSPELLESVRNSLAGSDVMKDIYAGTNSGLAGAGQLAGTGGLQAYDLEAPAKLLAPRPTPLRNRIARRKGIGTAHQYKRITGFTGTGTGGLSLMRPGITESSTTTFGAVNYLRGPKISYAGDQASVPYMQYGVSDQVSWAAQFSGQGYQDIRQLSQTSVLWSSMLLEERMLLGGRGTASGFAGALASPSATVAARAKTGTEVGQTAFIPTLYVWVTSVGIWGESVPTVVTSTALSATTTNVLDVTIPAVSGALGYKVYAGTTNTAAGVFLANVSSSGVAAPGAPGSVPGSGVVTINFNGGGTGGAPNSGTAATVAFPSGSTDSSASATDYDGLLTYCTGATSGYVKNISGVANGSGPTGSLNIANPGAEFYTAFAAMYDANKADPDEILANGNDRKQLSDLLKNASSASYRITVDSASQAHNAQIGALVTGVQNEVTGKMVDLTVHPWLPQGTMPIISWTLPLPDSNISDVFAVYNVQDYMAIEWPVTQFAYETSSYWYGTFVCYAPSYCGAITGITKL